MRRVLLLLMLVGCGIDESGLLDAHDGAPPIDVSVPDVAANDVTVDVAVNDAGVDVEQQQDAFADVVMDAPAEATVDAGPILTITGGN
jgi:hypothetical protein